MSLQLQTLNECALCPINSEWCNSKVYVHICQDILYTHKFSIRAACRIREFYYVVYDDNGSYVYYKHFKTLKKIIDGLILRLTTLSLEETLMLTKFRKDL